MHAGEQQAARSFLCRSVSIYEAMTSHVLRLEKRANDEEILKALGLTATLGWLAHPGRYADERLEEVALRAGRRLESPTDGPPPRTVGRPHTKNRRRRVLHVATTVYESGGHTRLIESWIRNDEASAHSLVLLHQRQYGVRAELSGAISASGGELVTLPDDLSLLDKARRLRDLARSGYDCLILHTHPNDVLPLVALATSKCPPVAVMNHADHTYWLGVSVADMVVEFRDFGARLSLERRGARENIIVPLPLDFTSTIERSAARERLGISDSEVMLLSIGSAYKYAPADRYDFFRTMRQVLDRNPTARLHLVGVSPADLAGFGVAGHERMMLIGTISDPTLYEAAADIYLEGFPHGSYTAFFETVARGICPVLLFAPTPQTDISGDPGLKGLVTSPIDEADYVARVTELINDPTMRVKLGQAAGRQVVSTHGVEGSRIYLQKLYHRLTQLTHQFLPPPKQGSSQMEEDLNLAGANNSRIKTALLSQVYYSAVTGFTAGDLLRLFLMSVRIRDTRLIPSHVRGWLGLIRHKISLPRTGTGVKA